MERGCEREKTSLIIVESRVNTRHVPRRKKILISFTRIKSVRLCVAFEWSVKRKREDRIKAIQLERVERVVARHSNSSARRYYAVYSVCFYRIVSRFLRRHYRTLLFGPVTLACRIWTRAIRFSPAVSVVVFVPLTKYRSPCVPLAVLSYRSKVVSRYYVLYRIETSIFLTLDKRYRSREVPTNELTKIRPRVSTMLDEI